MTNTYQRQFLSEFISLYKSFPCLWDITAKEYLDRGEKQKAYNRLVQKYKEIDKHATRSTVVKKINVLRTCYRRELGKLNKSLQSGCGDKAHNPKLWYFDLLAFLHESKSREVESSYDDDGSINTTSVNEPNQNILQHAKFEFINDSSVDSNYIATTADEQVYSSCSLSPIPIAEKRQVSSLNQESNPQTDSTNKRVMFSSKGEDSFDIFGKHIAYKLQSLNKQQYILAQKLINDVLFEGEMETLNRKCSIMDRNNHQPNLR
ncbi:uncharacterized protein LOC125764169 [Anopheles funestus]|uniref:uncharacterized protein LOC125764169 n=1 Tax=Anopheles funestus TaxID=62324 RepID=UPI0020C5D7D6|nr:uncharacterized protein LOC125764169 [Anopheles funestus]